MASNTDQTNFADLRLAVITAYTNIQNCLKRGNFTDTSLANLKHTRKSDFELIVSHLSEEPNNAGDWIVALHNLTIKIDEETVTTIHDTTVEKLKEKHDIRTSESISKVQPKSKFANRKKEVEPSESEYTSVPESDEESNIPRTSRKESHVDMDKLMKQLIGSFQNFAESNRTNKRLRIETLKNNTQVAQEWFSKFERQTILWTDADRGHELPSWLEDTALRYWELISDNDKYSYNIVKENLLQKFQMTDSSFKAKTSFYTMHQDINESVDEFSYRLFKCKRDWPVLEYALFDKDVITFKYH